MISFRYHLVSTIAVFLALGLGIVLGTTALNGPVTERLGADKRRLSTDNDALQRDAERLRGQVAAADAFALATAPRVVRGSLSGRQVLLVTTPTTPAGLVERMTPLLTQAGASLTGTLRLEPALAAPASGQLVEDLVAQVVPAGIALPDGPPVDRATAELAAALVRGGERAAVPVDQAQAVVSAFTEAGLVRFTAHGDGLRSATVAVVLTGDDDPSRAALSMVGALDGRADGTVLAGTSSARPDSPVRVLRGDRRKAAAVSSVDNADRATGQVAAVLALAQQMTGRSGQYGAGAGATAALPVASR